MVDDKRELNQGRKEQFEAFWKGVKSTGELFMIGDMVLMWHKCPLP